MTAFHTKSRAGLGVAVLSAATFGTSGTFASSLIDAGWSPAAAVTARIIAAAVMLTVPALLALRGRWAALRAAAWRVIAYGLVGVVGCQFSYFNALQRMPVGVALLLEYLGVILLVGWLWARHGQRPRRLTVTGSASAVIGLALVLNLTGSAHVSLVGVMWGLLAAVSLAVYFVLSAAGGKGSPKAGPELPPVAMAWGGMCVGAVVLTVLGAVGAVPVTASTRDVDLLGQHVSWVVPMLGVALLATVISYSTGIKAARLLGAKLGSFVSLLEVLFAVGYAWLLLHQLPSAIQFLGGGFIFAGVVLVRLDELRTDREPVPAAAGEEREPVSLAAP